MHHKSWSNLRKVLEQDRLAPALRGRVQYFMTRYHDAHDEFGRFCIRVDDHEVLNAYYYSDYVPYQTEDGVKGHRRMSQSECWEKGLFYVGEGVAALDTYLDVLSLDEALISDNPLIRLFAVLDRRVGKRRLPALAAAMETEPEWLQFFYRLRLEAEGYDLRPLTIRLGREEDLPGWMALVRRVAGNFPGLETETALQEHAATVEKFIRRGSAICALRGGEIVGVLLFSPRRNQLCCMAVAPENRRQGVAQGMFELMLTIADPHRDLIVTTFREGDPKAAAPRAFYMKNGFLPAEMVEENGYPCQMLVRPAFRVERLTEEMLPALFDYERRLSEEEPGFYRWTEEAGYQDKVRASFRDGRFSGALSFAAVTPEGKIVGRIDTALIPSHFDGSVKAYLDWLCVLKSWRHHGVAQALMAALRRELSARGVDTLVGLIAANDEAQRFYRNMQNALIRDEGIWIDC